MPVTFTDRVDGTTFFASHMNAVQDKIEVISGQVFNPMESTFGAVGDGVADDTVAVQTVFAAMVANGGGLFYKPPGKAFRVTDTITIEPPSSASFTFLGVLGGGDVNNIVWDGGSSKPVFRSRNWKYAAIEGIAISIPATVNDVVGFELKSDASYQSNTRLAFRDCLVSIASGAKGCGGWRAISDGGAGDFASMAWDSCGVVGSGTYNQDGNFGWRSLAANALIWNWRNCLALNLAYGWNNKSLITLLNGAINDSVTTVTVDDAGYLPYAGAVVIDTERISYTSRNATQLLGCTRGAGGTTPASHVDNSATTEYHTGSSTPGGSWTIVGPNSDTVGTVFNVNKGPVAIYGGRSEVVDRLFLGGYGGSTAGQRYLISGHLVVETGAPTNNVLVGIGVAGNMRIEACEFVGTNFTSACISANGVDGFGAAGSGGALTIQDTAIQGASGNVFWTLPSTWKANVRNTSRVNSVFQPQTRCDTRQSGTGTIASGSTSATVTHGLPTTPTLAGITVTLGENPTGAIGAVWVDTIGATTFQVNVEVDPGASNLDFGWSASVE